MAARLVRVGASLILLGVLLALAEAFFYARLPQRHLPFDGVRDGVRYTWGHPVTHNRHGFREREFAIPKPPAAYRVMVLGDSLTWGPGLALEERYTDRAEALLDRQFPRRDIEVLNFGVPGASLRDYRDTLRTLEPVVQPDLVVIGFCLNDPQPAAQNFSRERQKLENDFASVFSALAVYGWVAPNTERRARAAIWSTLEVFGVVPRWPQALDRAYRPDSDEWKAFIAALRDVRRFCDEMNLPPPILTILNQGSSAAKPTYYSNPDALLALILGWYEQVKAAASASGLLPIDHAAEFKAELDGHVLAVNDIDGHPGVEQNRIYADKLAVTIAHEYLQMAGTEIEVRSLGIPSLAPAAKSVFQVADQAAPFDGSAFVVYDVNGTAPPLTNAGPDGDNGVHEAVRLLDAAQRQIDAFLRPDDMVQNFCDGPCFFRNAPGVEMR